MSNKQVNYDGLSETFQIDNDFENGLEDLLGSLDTNKQQDVINTVDDENDKVNEPEEDNDEPNNEEIINVCENIIVSPIQQNNLPQQQPIQQNLEIQVNQVPEKIDNTDYLDKQLKNIIRSCESMIETAQYQVSSSGTPESIEAASKLIVAAGTLMTEMNKQVMLDRTHRKKVELEAIRAQHRLVELEKKYKLIMEKDTKKLTMGQGNQFNQTNNYMVFEQEKLVDFIREQQQK